jgi:chloramphenicol-sensitive protein RarD
VLPVYWKLLLAVPAPEIVAHRLIWSVVFASISVLVAGRFGEARRVLGDPARSLALCLSGALMASNWALFLWAIGAGRILEASVGYYLSSLVSVAFGVTLLGERLRRAQLVGIAFAVFGVGVLWIGSGSAPWLPVVLATTFALYGLVRKVTSVTSLVGFLVETMAVAPIALVALVWGERSQFASRDLADTALLALSGAVSAPAVIWSASAARRLPLSTFSLFQYLAPTLSALLAVVVYGEPLTPAREIAVACVWLGIALFGLDSLRVREAAVSRGREA